MTSEEKKSWINPAEVVEEQEGTPEPTLVQAVVYLGSQIGRLAEALESNKRQVKIGTTTRQPTGELPTELTSPQVLTPATPTKQQPQTKQTIATSLTAPGEAITVSISEMFPEDLRAMIKFEEANECILVRPKQYLGPENFAKIGAIIRQLNGEYISSGKLSHFRVPK